MNIFDLLEQCHLTKNNYFSKDKVQNDDKVEPYPNNGESAKTKLQLRQISSSKTTQMHTKLVFFAATNFKRTGVMHAVRGISSFESRNFITTDKNQ